MRSLLKGMVVLPILLFTVPAFAQWDDGVNIGPGDPGPAYTGLASTIFPPDFSEVYPDGYFRPVATGFPFPEERSADPAPGGGLANCEQRFRSYNPATGTYLGYDGRHHPCP